MKVDVEMQTLAFAAVLSRALEHVWKRLRYAQMALSAPRYRKAVYDFVFI